MLRSRLARTGAAVLLGLAIHLCCCSHPGWAADAAQSAQMLTTICNGVKHNTAVMASARGIYVMTNLRSPFLMALGRRAREQVERADPGAELIPSRGDAPGCIYVVEWMLDRPRFRLSSRLVFPQDIAVRSTAYEVYGYDGSRAWQYQPRASKASIWPSAADLRPVTITLDGRYHPLPALLCLEWDGKPFSHLFESANSRQLLGTDLIGGVECFKVALDDHIVWVTADNRFTLRQAILRVPYPGGGYGEYVLRVEQVIPYADRTDIAHTSTLRVYRSHAGEEGKTWYETYSMTSAYFEAQPPSDAPFGTWFPPQTWVFDHVAGNGYMVAGNLQSVISERKRFVEARAEFSEADQ